MEWAQAHGISKAAAQKLAADDWKVGVLLSSKDGFVDELCKAGEKRGPATEIWLKLQAQGTARSHLAHDWTPRTNNAGARSRRRDRPLGRPGRPSAARGARRRYAVLLPLLFLFWFAVWGDSRLSLYWDSLHSSSPSSCRGRCAAFPASFPSFFPCASACTSADLREGSVGPQAPRLVSYDHVTESVDLNHPVTCYRYLAYSSDGRRQPLTCWPGLHSAAVCTIWSWRSGV